MARLLAAPFSLPQPGRRGSPPVLGAPQYLVLLVGVTLLPLSIVLLLLYPGFIDAIDRRELLRYRGAFGFAVGDVPRREPDTHTYFGVTAVTPGGQAERAGLRERDVVVGSGSALMRAVREAAAGRTACVEVWNLVDEHLLPASRPPTRRVCFGPDRP